MKSNKKKILLVMLSILLLISLSLSFAYLLTKSEKKNTFVIGTVDPEIKEEFDGTNKIKKDVYVKNNGNVSVYVRVGLIYSFEDSNGNILSEEPVLDTDYTIDFSDSSNWLLGSDGYYYYKTKVGENEKTDILIEECKQIKNYDDKTFNVEILVQTLQAEPQRAVTDAWDININNGNIEVE